MRPALLCRISLSALACALLFVTLNSSPSNAQESAGDSASSANPNSKFSLSGTVVNSVTGEGVRRALVQLTGSSAASTLTDSEGHFVLDGLPAGQVNVMTRKPGFFSEQDLSADPVSPALIQIGPKTPVITLKLLPEAVILGRVTSVDGQPVEDIPVIVYEQKIVDGRKSWQQRGRVTADGDGQFRVGSLPPGNYYLAAGPGLSYRIRPATRNGRNEGYPFVFYPGAPDISSATPIALNAGQQVEADFLLKPEAMYKISGVVGGYSPGMGVGLQFMNNSGEAVTAPRRFNPMTGQFQAEMLAGNYILRAQAQSTDGSEDLVAEIPVVVNSDLTGISIILGPGTSIPVNVHLEGGAEESAPNFGIAGTRPGRGRLQRVFFGPVNVQLTSTQNSFRPKQFWATPAPGANEQEHNLFIHNIEPGTYTVEINASGPWYVQSATCGNVDLLREDLRVAAGAQMAPINIVLRGDGASLSGTIESDGHAGRGSVLLVPDRASVSRVQTTFVMSGGQFQFDRLAPGDYRVLAVDHADKIEFRNPEVLSAYLSRASRVTLQSGAQAKTTVELIEVGQQ